MTHLVRLFQSIPGVAVDWAEAHPFVAAIVAIVLVGGGYLLLLKLALALQDAEDVRNRRK
jgi:hypothetical protein